jgi:ribonuclease BN (tRNA processing enzyme)
MKPVSVKFLGSGDAFGCGGRLQTRILIEAPGTKFILDCGASALISMKRFDVSTAVKAGFTECARRSETRPIMRFYIGHQ